MKKAFVLLLVFLMMGSIAYAKKGGKTTSKPESKITEAKSTLPAKAKDAKELKMISEKKVKELEAENKERKGAEKEVYKNQNEVRLAVHNLLAMEKMLGGIGPKVSAIARSFNNSVKKTIDAETRIKKKGRVSKFFTGGDREAAKDLEKEVGVEYELLRGLKDLTNKVETGIEAKKKMEEQVQVIEREVKRLKTVAEEEMKKMGVLGK